MWESATAGCQASWLLKSRSTAQTRSIGASMIADRVTRCMASAMPEIALEGVESRLEDALPDIVGEPALLSGRGVELGGPFGKRAIAVGDRRQLQGRDVVFHAHRRFQDRVGALIIVIRKRQQLLANGAAILQTEIADAADAVGRPIALDARFRDRRVPFRQTVEVADERPHCVRRSLDNARGVDANHEPSSSRLTGLPPGPSTDELSCPTLPGSRPISLSISSMSGAWARKRSAEFTT